jgi:pyruvate,water dikinase
VRAYRQREGILEDDLGMGVIVQEMVPADWSGVMFTRDPQGHAGDMRIEAVAGLGEALVSGRVTPLDFVVDRETLSVQSRSGTEQLDFLEDLARLGLRVERRSGFPQDIEWAVTAEGLQLLQARPITVARPLDPSDDGFDSTPRPGDTYTSRGVAEMLPGALPPLLWTINAPMLSDAFHQMFTRLGVHGTPHDRPTVGRFRGRAALNLSVLREVAEALPGGSASEVERQYLGRAVSQEPEQTTTGFAFGAAIRNWRARRLTADEVGVFCTAVSCLEELDVDVSCLPAANLLKVRARIRELAWRGYTAEVAAASAAGAAYRALEIVLARWLGEAAAEWAQRLTAGTLADVAVGTTRMRRLRRLYERHVPSHTGMAAALTGTPAGRVEARLDDLGAEGRAFVDDLHSTVERLGCRSVYAGATWSEDMEGVWRQMALFAQGRGAPSAPPSHEQALAELSELLGGSARWKAGRILTGQFVDLRGRWIARLAADATSFLALRERAKSALLVLGGHERRLICEVAGRLTAAGQLLEPDDVLMLTDTELEAMILGAEPVSSAEIERRKSAFARAVAADPLPEIFTGHPDRLAPAEESGGPLLEGWAASPGQVVGPARVIATLAEGAALLPGEILVAHSTDASWTPLFLDAGGVVLEEGGPLSHAAIVAREFGLPAVLAVRGVVKTVQVGEHLEVDGTRGIIRRLDVEEER